MLGFCYLSFRWLQHYRKRVAPLVKRGEKGKPSAEQTLYRH